MQTILEKNFLGMYLYGSLASGDFDEQSDVDFVVVTADAVSPETVSLLKAMHSRLGHTRPGMGMRLEGSYVPRADLRRYKQDGTKYPTLNDRKFYLDKQYSDWIIQRHILRECGVSVIGDPPRNFIDPVAPEELRGAVTGILNEWWEPMLHNPDFLKSGPYQAYAVLTMCRALFTLEHGAVASKSVSARWVQENLRQQAGLIEGALKGRSGAPFNELEEVINFIRYTVNRANSGIDKK